MDGFNHVLITFLQKKIEAIEESARFRLPAAGFSKTGSSSSASSGRIVRWESQKKPAQEEIPGPKEPSFKVLPAVSWQCERFELPSSSSSRKQKKGDAIYYLAPTPTTTKQRPVFGKARWASFRGLAWECNGRRKRARVEVTFQPTVVDMVDVVEDVDDDKSSCTKPVYATPMARSTAQKAKIDLASIPGTGDHGRVTLDDVKDVLFPLLLEQTTRRLFPPASSSSSSIITTATTSPKAHRTYYATPMARTTARDAQIDLSTIRGTGELGRITSDDVKRVIAKEGKDEETAKRELSAEIHAALIAENEPYLSSWDGFRYQLEGWLLS
jgi:hypothetical protein